MITDGSMVLQKRMENTGKGIYMSIWVLTRQNNIVLESMKTIMYFLCSVIIVCVYCTMCVPKFCSSCYVCVTNYSKTLWLKVIIMYILLTFGQDWQSGLFQLQLVTARVAQRLGTRIIWRLALMSGSWCWLLAETFAWAVD